MRGSGWRAGSWAAVPLALATGLGLASPARADDVASQVRALEQARAICAAAAPGDRVEADRALSILGAGLGQSQPELQADLMGTPPDFKSAGVRIDELESALQHPISTHDPVRAERDLKDILAQPRYRASGPSLFDRALLWLLQQLARLLRLLRFGNGGASLAQLVEIALAALVVLVAVAFTVRQLSRRTRATPLGSQPAKRWPAEAWFAEADSLAGAGDYPGALRALTTAVSTRVGGEGAWDRSPLTVRELFATARLLPQLRPLLVPFEASVYGHRQPDAVTYAEALAVAMAFREAEASLEAA